MASNENSGPVTRKRSKVDKQLVKDHERVQNWLQPVVVIGPNDIVVNPHLGKVKLEQEVKSEIGAENNEDSGKVLVANEEVMDFEEGVLVVKEEEDDNQVRNDQEEDEENLINSKQIKEILEENRLLKIKMKEKETAVQEMKKSLKEKETENIILRKEVKVLKETVSSQQKSHRISTQHKIIPDLNVEAQEDEEIQNMERQIVPAVLALFPEVIQLIWKKYKHSFIRRRNFLNLRFVCSAWKKSIDGIIAGPCQALQRELTVFYNDNIQWLDVKFDPGTGRHEEQMESDAPPFSLAVVYYNPGEVSKEERDKLAKLLSKVGHGIKEFTFYKCSRYRGRHWGKEDTFYCGGIPVQDKLRKRFIRCLTFLPNLIKVQFKHFDGPNAGVGFGTLCLTIEPQLDEKFVEFPNLPKLRHLDLPYGFLKEALLANPYVTSLVISELGFENVNPRSLKKFLHDKNMYALPYLEKLELRCEQTMGECVITSVGILFESSKVLQLPLKVGVHTEFPVMPELQTLVIELVDNHKCNQAWDIRKFVWQFFSVENLIFKNFVLCNCKDEKRCKFRPEKQPLESGSRRKNMKTHLVDLFFSTFSCLSNLKKVEITESSKIPNAKTFVFLPKFKRLKV